MADFAWRIPKGDSRTTAMTVTVSNVPISLEGYDVTVTATQIGATVPVTFTRTSAVGGVGVTSLGPTIEAVDTATAGFYSVVMRANRVGYPGPYTALGTLEVIDAP
jgi:hypothetical protein